MHAAVPRTTHKCSLFSRLCNAEKCFLAHLPLHPPPTGTEAAPVHGTYGHFASSSLHWDVRHWHPPASGNVCKAAVFTLFTLCCSPPASLGSHCWPAQCSGSHEKFSVRQVLFHSPTRAHQSPKYTHPVMQGPLLYLERRVGRLWLYPAPSTSQAGRKGAAVLMQPVPLHPSRHEGSIDTCALMCTGLF